MRDPPIHPTPPASVLPHTVEQTLDTRTSQPDVATRHKCDPKQTGFFRYQAVVHNFYMSQRCQILVALLIMGNFLTNVIEKQIDPSGAKYSATFVSLEDAFNVVFLIELLLNAYANWLCAFWKSSWNVFDTVVVSVGVVSLSWWGIEFPDSLRLLRILRALRVFRLFKRIKSLNQIISALALAIPGTVNAFVVLFLMVTIFAILGVEFFREFGVVRTDPVDYEVPPYMCQYASQHRPWTPPYRMNTSYPHEPYYESRLGLTHLDAIASTLTLEEFDAQQMATDLEAYEIRIRTNKDTVKAHTMRALCIGEEYFGSFFRSWFSLFQCLTTESWDEAVARPIVYHWTSTFPPVMAWILSGVFFMFYTFVMWLFLSNVVISVLLDKFLSAQQPKDDEEDEIDAAEAAREAAREAAVRRAVDAMAGNGAVAEGKTVTAAEEKEELKALITRHREMACMVDSSALLLEGIMRELVRRNKLDEQSVLELDRSLGQATGATSPPTVVDLDSPMGLGSPNMPCMEKE